LTVSVNVSGRQLMSTAFHGMVAEALSETVSMQTLGWDHGVR
jgi:hypothetical protein